MAKEALYIPEEELGDVIRVIRAGLKVEDVPESTRRWLTAWCNEEERYLKGEDD